MDEQVAAWDRGRGDLAVAVREADHADGQFVFRWSVGGAAEGERKVVDEGEERGDRVVDEREQE